MSSETKRLIAFMLSLATTVLFVMELGHEDGRAVAAGP
jgi:hypothetical protein